MKSVSSHLIRLQMDKVGLTVDSAGVFHQILDDRFRFAKEAVIQSGVDGIASSYFDISIQHFANQLFGQNSQTVGC